MQINTKINNFKRIVNEDPNLKVLAYGCIGLFSIYVLGRIFKILAIAIRSINDFNSALNGS